MEEFNPKLDYGKVDKCFKLGKKLSKELKDKYKGLVEETAKFVCFSGGVLYYTVKHNGLVHEFIISDNGQTCDLLASIKVSNILHVPINFTCELFHHRVYKKGKMIENNIYKNESVYKS